MQTLHRVPITVAPPLTGQAVGPGTEIKLSTDFIGPLPTTAFWTFEVSTNPGELFVALGRNHQNTPQASVWIGLERSSTGSQSQLLFPQPALPVTQTTGTGIAVLWQDEGVVLEQTSGPVTWRPEPAGVAWLQSVASSSVISGGFTETDRAVLESTNASVLAQLPLTIPAGGLISFGIDQLLKGPPIDLLAEGENLLLSGRGSITRTFGSTGVYAYGGRWAIESAPPGLGKLDGQAVLYEQRIAQFVVVKNRLGGGLYAFQIEDSHYDSGELSWPVPFPVRVDFDVLPGVTVRWRWLLLLQ